MIIIYSLLFQAKRLQRWAYQTPEFVTLYGFTKNETTGQYLLVLEYFENGDLRKQEVTTWEKKIGKINWIALQMKNIHDAGMIHR